MSRENIEISFTSELPDGIPRQDARRENRHCLRESARAAGDRRRVTAELALPEPEMCGEVTDASSPSGRRWRRQSR
jgi:hypothetical protein